MSAAGIVERGLARAVDLKPGEAPGLAAAFGYLTPVQGALIQESIDVAVILNALRALRISPADPLRPSPTSGGGRLPQTT